jgi:L-malate glycosyltransferase
VRVAIIIPSVERLGPILMIQTLVNSLSQKENLEIDVYYLDKKIDSGIKIAATMIRYSFSSMRYEDYDIVHTNGIRPDFLAFLNRKRIKYHISTIHNFVFEDLKFNYNRLISFIFGRLWLKIWSRADKLVCVSKAMKSYYGRWFRPLKVEVIYNGISCEVQPIECDDDIIKTIYGFRGKGLKILGVIGILAKRKGFDQVLNLLSIEEDYALILIGEGRELSVLQNQAQKLKIEDRTFFCGFRAEAKRYLRYFDFFIMPSRSEGFGLALIEAVQQRVPVICSDIEVFKELFNSSEVTFFKLDDLTSLPKALKIAMETGKEKIESAYFRFLNNFTDKLMARKYYELYLSAQNIEV